MNKNKCNWGIGLLLMSSFLSSNIVLADHFNGHVDVTVNALSANAQKGQLAFNRTCGTCHGENGEGTLKGPPMIHGIYNPGHHSNKSFYSAVRNGVKQHHWPYGDMPAQKEVGFSEMSAIVQFVREVQQQNGIIQQEHKM